MTLKTMGNIGYGLVIFALALIAGLVALSAFDIPNGYRLYTVQSGSMSPAISTGSIVVLKPEISYGEGDVITFKNPEDRTVSRPVFTTTHRIIDATESAGVVKFQTKGDANDGPDGTLVEKDLIIGKVQFHIPLLGFPVSFAKSREGLIALVIVPATIIIWSEIVNIKNEVFRLWQKRKSPKEPVKKDE